MKYGFSHGSGAEPIQDYVIYYSEPLGILSAKQEAFLQGLETLRQKGVIQAYHSCAINPSVALTLGMNPQSRQKPDYVAYVMYDFLTKSNGCKTTYCGVITDDIFAYNGGGLLHSINYMEDQIHIHGNDRIFIMAPPLAQDMIDTSLGIDYRDQTFWDDPDIGAHKMPVNWHVWPLKVSPPAAPSSRKRAISETATTDRTTVTTNDLFPCNATRPFLSTRYMVIHKQRFLEMIPKIRATNARALYFEHVRFLFQRGYSKAFHCPSRLSSFVIHPPIRDMGARFFQRCPVSVIQSIVEGQLDGLLVSEGGDMDEASFTQFCRSILLSSRANNTGSKSIPQRIKATSKPRT